MRSFGGRGAEESIAIIADLSARGAGIALHEQCAARGLAVELLVNNAGSGLFGKSAELPSDKVEAMLSLNILSLTSLCALFGRDMSARGRGRILNVGSLAGGFALPYFASYAGSKAMSFPIPSPSVRNSGLRAWRSPACCLAMSVRASMIARASQVRLIAPSPQRTAWTLPPSRARVFGPWTGTGPTLSPAPATK